MNSITEKEKSEQITLPILFLNDDGGIEFNHGGRPSEEIRAFIMDMKDRLMLAAADQIQMPVSHEFCDGMYLRKLFIKKGTIVVGKIHRLDCHNIVASGDISILTELGSGRVRAGYSSVSFAGIQKLGYAHEDTLFINVFRTNEADVSKIDEVVACESYEALKGGASCLLHG